MKEAKSKNNSKPQRRGFALVITLIMILLITTLVMAFFLKTTSRLWITENKLQILSSELVVRSAVSVLEADLSQEIASSSEGAPSVTSPLKDIPGFERIIKSSIEDTPFSYQGALIINSSGESTSSGGSFSIRPAKWDKPLLNSSSFDENTVPNWVYLNKDGFISARPENASQGRFAYIVYDTGALLDVNVAGHGAAAREDLSFKGGLTWINLENVFSPEQVGYEANAAIQGIPEFRLTDWEDYRGSQAERFFHTTAFRLPYLSDTATGNIFESRQDFLRYLRSKKVGLTPSTSHPANYFTTFNRLNNAASSEDLRELTHQEETKITTYDDQGHKITYEVRAGDPLIQRKFSLAKLAWLKYDGPNTEAFPYLTDEAIKDCFGLKWNEQEKLWEYTSPDSDATQPEIADITTSLPNRREPDFFERLLVAFKTKEDAYSIGSFVDYDALPEDKFDIFGCEQHLLDSNVDLHVLRIGANMIDAADGDDVPTRVALNFGGVTLDLAGVEDLPYLAAFYMTTTYKHIPTGVTENVQIDDSGSNKDSQIYDMQSMHFFALPKFFNPHRKSPDTEETVQFIRLEVSSGSFDDFEIRKQSGSVASPHRNHYFDPASFSQLPVDLTNLSPMILARDHFDVFRNGILMVEQLHNASDHPPLFDQGVYIQTEATNYRPRNYPNYDTTRGWILFDFNDATPDLSATQDYVYDYALWSNVMNNGNAIQAKLRPDITELKLSLSYSLDGTNWHNYQYFGGHPKLVGIGGINHTKTTNDYNGNAFGVGYSIQMRPETVDTAESPNPSDDLAWSKGARVAYYLDPRTNRFGTLYINRRKFERYYDEKSGIEFKYWVPLSDDVPSYASPFDEELTPTYATKFLGRTFIKPSVASWDPELYVIEDPDGVTRPPDASLSEEINPFNASNTNNAEFAGRPFVLNRPFRSIGELGYVYRDVPWKTLDLNSEDSGDSRLAELFSVRHEPLVTAGRIHLQSMPRWKDDTKIMQALLYGAAKDLGAQDITEATVKDVQNLAQSIQSEFENITDYSEIIPQVLGNSEIQGQLNRLAGTNENQNSEYIKYQREFVSRALLDSIQDSTWNLMVDIIAQSGRNTQSRYIPHAEKRIWLHLAIDRETGKIIDRKIEYVHD
ncbi:MAG: hypothetical protein AAF984_05115 [Verrucomicrobiota bacterium]